MAVAQFFDHEEGGGSGWTRCNHCGAREEIDGLPDDGPIRAAILAQSGRWQLFAATTSSRRREAIAALRGLGWSVDRLRDVPAEGETLVGDGTYGECNAAARRLEEAGVGIRFAHVSGDMTGLVYPPTEAEKLAERIRDAEADASITSRRCPHCGVPCPSYRRTCKACRMPVN